VSESMTIQNSLRSPRRALLIDVEAP